MSEMPVNLRDYEGFDEQLLLDSSDGKGGYVLIPPSGHALRVSSSAYTLLQAVRNGTPLSKLAKSLPRTSVEPERLVGRLERAREEVLDKLAEIQRRSAAGRLPWGFWIRRPLIQQTTVVRAASALSFLYNRFVVSGALACIAVLACWLALQGIDFRVRSSSFVAGYLVFLLSLVAHEFGHATACARYKAKPSEIGFALYLIYPALYSNVGSSWKLNRWKRVAVDLGGSYFQLLYGAILFALFEVTHWAALKVALLMIIYACVFCLNPIFRFDGYWVLADALGVPDLSRQPSKLTVYFMRRLIRRPVDRLPWSTPVIIILVGYALVSNLVWALFIFTLLPTVASSSRRLFLLSSHMAGQLLAGRIPGAAELFTLALALYFSVVIIVMIYQFSKLVYGVARKYLEKHAHPMAAVLLDEEQSFDKERQRWISDL